MQITFLSHCFSYSPSRILRRSTRFPRRNSSSVTPVIELTKTEQEIFDFFEEVLKRRNLENVTIRVVGGWVRDKLLSASQPRISGKISDIDLLIDNVTCRKLDGQLTVCRNQWKHNPFPSFPFKSSFPLNFVLLPRKIKTTNPYLQLVSGFYKSSSGGNRITIDIAQPSPINYYDLRFIDDPLYDISVGNSIRTILEHEQQFRPPSESKTLFDAYYRDLTMNSLFYNLRTRQIEDFTGKGVSDLLSNRLLRTPFSSPELTVLSNPLTSLRTIRFACKLNFTIDESLLSYCCSSDGSRRINALISSKVSNYRLQKEFSAILFSASSSLSFVRGIYLFHKMNLLAALFPIRETVLPLISSIKENSQQKELHSFHQNFSEKSFYLNGVLLSLLLPFSHYYFLQNNLSIASTTISKVLEGVVIDDSTRFLM
jgi:hypothetical protein